jgi:peroxiredoxin
MKSKAKIPVLPLMVVILLILTACTSFLPSGATIPEGQAPDFSLPHLLEEGKRVALSDYRGQPVVVNFFANWCVPCREEMPTLEATYQTYREEGLVILGIGTQDDQQVLSELVTSLGVTFPVVWDESDEMFDAYRVRAMPTTFFVNREGMIKQTIVGALTEEQLEQEVEVLLSEK